MNLPFENIKRKILIKKEAETSKEYGSYPESRPIKEAIEYGIINLNKPSGPTSHQVSDYVKKILKLDKAGHSGTLDPGVNGVLPTALGKATRIVQTLLPAGKEYICLMHIHKPVEEEKIKQTFNDLIGKIKQLPPIKSAIKRQIRTREIYYIEIIEINKQDVLFKIGCQAGTYIRKFCHDLGLKLNTHAHMVQLLRSKAGPYNIKNSITLHDLKDAYEYYKQGDESRLKKIILPIESAIQYNPKIYVLDSSVDSICHGASLSTPGISKLDSDIKTNDNVVILTLKGELICLGKAVLSSQEMLKEKGLAVKTSKVFMSPGLYPKYDPSKKI